MNLPIFMLCYVLMSSLMQIWLMRIFSRTQKMHHLRTIENMNFTVWAIWVVWTAWAVKADFNVLAVWAAKAFRAARRFLRRFLILCG